MQEREEPVETESPEEQLKRFKNAIAFGTSHPEIYKRVEDYHAEVSRVPSWIDKVKCFVGLHALVCFQGYAFCVYCKWRDKFTKLD